MDNSQMASFQAALKSSSRILALGLSASSGLATFRGTGGLWHEYDAMQLATPEAFAQDPALVWKFYSERRGAALRASPNKAHYALAQLALKSKNFLTLTQNVDGLSSRAGHPADQLLHLHGSLFALKCTSFYCDYKVDNDFTHPLTSALGKPDLHISVSDLPHCPKCTSGLLRPNVVWFGEALPYNTVQRADDFISQGKVDLILVIGTSGTVYPAAAYTDRVRLQGGKVAVFNIDVEHDSDDDDRPDWVFQGDAAELVPEALYPVIHL
ncbi:DHS-like NAD/FAD-binding domain-containing protein [Lipomyces arxii]|uniref:DHS-like NAD/FAD-binding domain-containing protein n=1 Tax=Lipomyces arxii TaxID=56418 RepID=UPI0034CF92E7